MRVPEDFPPLVRLESEPNYVKLGAAEDRDSQLYPAGGGQADWPTVGLLRGGSGKLWEVIGKTSEGLRRPWKAPAR